MKFGEFCEKALSNDVICIVDNIMHVKSVSKAVAAYRFLLEDGEGKPSWANEMMDKEVERFTYGKCAADYDQVHLIVQLR